MSGWQNTAHVCGGWFGINIRSQWYKNTVVIYHGTFFFQGWNVAINYCCIGYCFILRQCFKTWLGNKLPFHGKYWGNIALKHRMTVLPRKATNHGKMFYNIGPSLLDWCDVEVYWPSVNKNLKNILSLEMDHTTYSCKLR